MGNAHVAYLRRRQADAATALDQVPGRPPDDPGRMLAQTLAPVAPAVYPTGVPAYFLCAPLTLGGVTSEGGAATQSASGSASVCVYVLGPAVPAAGALVVARAVGGRWAAQYGTPGGAGPPVVVPGCPCPSSPATLHMTSSSPTSNNQIFQSATLVYGATPSALAALGLGPSSYLSTASFTDLSTSDQFWYYLSCYLSYYILTRVYVTSLYGSPYLDITRYRWPISYPTNTCAPFSLQYGQIFSGGDPTCVVTIAG